MEKTMGDISKHFDRKEFACQDKCGFDTVDVELITVLEDLREHFDSPVRINSASRCKKHNDRIGGADKSQHLVCRAADVAVDKISPIAVWEYLNYKYMGYYGVGRYESFTHIDTRKNSARW
jgi:uncharacterized protein YcbK (DUF882 family)